jgi:hypothetical protein
MRETTLPQRPSDLGFSVAVEEMFTQPPKTASEPEAELSHRPIDILRILTSRFGPEWIVWEPETLWTELKRSNGKAVPEPVRNKIQGLKTLLVSDAFWRDHLVFEKVVMAFNNHVPLFDQYQNPSPAMIANAIEEAATIRTAEYSDDVLRYMAVVCFQDGLVVLPEPLDVAQASLDELIQPIVGRQFREDIRHRWSEAKDGSLPPSLYDETPTGVHLAKMAAIREYVRTF